MPLLDAVVAGYALICSTLLLLFRRRIPDHRRLLLYNAAAMLAAAGIYLVSQRVDNFLFGGVHALYPLLLYPGFHIAGRRVEKAVGLPLWDGWILRLEERLFGAPLALKVALLARNRPLSEWFSFAYFTFILFFPVVGLALLFRFNPDITAQAFLRITACLTGGYLLSVVTPVEGPRFFLQKRLEQFIRFGRNSTPRMPGFIFNRLNYWSLSRGAPRGGAFPSLHCAGALIMTSYCFRFGPEWGLLASFLTLNVAVATVFIHSHYAVDSLAGFAWGGLFLLLPLP